MLAKKERDSNFELLRIIAMILIVMTHIGHSGAGDLENVPAANMALFRLFQVGSQIGVGAFILISGYFLVNSKFRFERLFSLLVQIFTYSTVIYLVFVSAGLVQFEWKQAIFAFFPVSTNAYWFLSAYVITYVLSPFINVALKHINQKSHVALMILLVVVCGILPFISNFHALGNVAWFVLLYITGGYIKKYPKMFEKTLPYLVILLCGVMLGAVLSAVKKIGIFSIGYPTTYVCAISLFVVFKNLKIKHNPVINLLSSATLGVYLVHDNGYVRPLLWGTLFRTKEIIMTNDFWWKALVCFALVYVVCTTIELLRQGFFKILDKFVRYNVFEKDCWRFLK